MRTPPQNASLGSFPRPQKPFLLFLVTLFTVWVLFAIGQNWLGASPALFLAFTGNTEGLANGELYRLVTAAFLHDPVGGAGVQHILFALLGLTLLGSPLERTIGPRRLLRLLVVTALFSYTVAFLVDLALPASLSVRLMPEHYFGSTPLLEAVAISFALNLKDQKILLFFVLPIGSRGLIVATIGLSLLLVLANALGPSGHIAPFAGILAGWLFGGSSPSPLRRLYLKWRLARLDAEASQGSRRGRDRGHLQVLPGGKSRSRSDLH